MKWISLFWVIPYTSALLFGTRKLNLLDKTHVKNICGFMDSYLENKSHALIRYTYE